MSTSARWLAVETTARAQIQMALINVDVTLIIREHIARKVQTYILKIASVI